MSASRRNRDDVHAALEGNIENVLEAYGVEATLRGDQYRLTTCPSCGEETSREAVAINSCTGQWLHHGREQSAGGECSGDVFSLIAALEGLDCKREFRQVLEIAASIVGLDVVADAGLEMRKRRENERADRHRQVELAERVLDIERRRIAVETWRTLSWHHEDGEQYLRSRGLGPLPLAGHVVRYDVHCDVCVLLHSLDDGEPVTVVRHVLAPCDGTPKVMVPKGGTTRGSLIGRVTEIAAGSTVVVTEGITDSLTAMDLWPDAVVLGAQCAGQLRAVVAAAAPRVFEHGGRIVLVPDDDEVGLRSARSAASAARDAGLKLGRTLIVASLGEHHDLNAAYSVGWRP